MADQSVAANNVKSDQIVSLEWSDKSVEFRFTASQPITKRILQGPFNQVEATRIIDTTKVQNRFDFWKAPFDSKTLQIANESMKEARNEFQAFIDVQCGEQSGHFYTDVCQSMRLGLSYTDILSPIKAGSAVIVLYDLTSQKVASLAGIPFDGNSRNCVYIAPLATTLDYLHKGTLDVERKLSGMAS
jgi:hypothetical protein